MRRRRRRKCLNCGELFRPNPRNVHHQRYCSEPPCRKASKAASQARWLAKPQNRDYYRGPAHTERVRAWRAANPGYWRRRRRALQDRSSTQVIDPAGKTDFLTAPALQEDCRAKALFDWTYCHFNRQCDTRRHSAHEALLSTIGPGHLPGRTASWCTNDSCEPSASAPCRTGSAGWTIGWCASDSAGRAGNSGRPAGGSSRPISSRMRLRGCTRCCRWIGRPGPRRCERIGVLACTKRESERC